MPGHQDPADAQRAFNSLRAQKAAHARWSKHDRREGTAPARAAFYRKFEKQVDPDGTLPPDERARRAESARKAYMAGIALKGLKTRQQNAKRRASLQQRKQQEESGE